MALDRLRSVRHRTVLAELDDGRLGRQTPCRAAPGRRCHPAGPLRALDRLDRASDRRNRISAETPRDLDQSGMTALASISILARSSNSAVTSTTAMTG